MDRRRHVSDHPHPYDIARDSWTLSPMCRVASRTSHARARPSCEPGMMNVPFSAEYMRLDHDGAGEFQWHPTRGSLRVYRLVCVEGKFW